MMNDFYLQTAAGSVRAGILSRLAESRPDLGVAIRYCIPERATLRLTPALECRRLIRDAKPLSLLPGEAAVDRPDWHYAVSCDYDEVCRVRNQATTSAGRIVCWESVGAMLHSHAALSFAAQAIPAGVNRA